MVTAVVGGNWGDEGKGKITDLLAESADIVVRFQGGANAGHTIINEYGKSVLHILPSGVFRKNTINVIGSGVALSLDSLFKELEEAKSKGVEPQMLISDRVQVIMPYHVKLDQLEEERLGKNSFGSTKSGIAPFYSDKYLKIGFQICEMFDENLLEKLERICDVKNKYISAVYDTDYRVDPKEMYDYLMSYKDRVEPLLCNLPVFMSEAVKSGKNILLEGQLGALKDVDSGIYPMVTSSSPVAGFGSVGASVPPYEIKRIVVITKAYSSSVGAGAFASEIFGDEAKELRDRGGDCGEYGATTGRPRRMGWFDTVASRYGCIVQGATEVTLSLLDVLGYLDKIPVCTAYEIDGKITKDFPVTHLLNKAKPVYTYLDGWKCDISGIKNYDELPENAKKYVEFIEKELGYPIKMISNGPKRDDIIVR